MSARAEAPALSQALPLLHGGSSGPIKTHCPYCAFQCGMSVTRQPNQDVSISADEEFPVNRGQMCIKGFTSGALLDHPARLRSPLLRGPNGELAPVSWEAALDYVAERITSLQRAHGASAVGTFGSGP